MLFDNEFYRNFINKMRLTMVNENYYTVKGANRIFKIFISKCNNNEFINNRNIFLVSSHNEVRCKIVTPNYKNGIPVIMTKRLHCCEPYCDVRLGKHEKMALDFIRDKYTEIIIIMYELGIRQNVISQSEFNKIMTDNRYTNTILPDTPYDILIEYDPENADKLRKIKENHVK